MQSGRMEKAERLCGRIRTRLFLRSFLKYVLPWIAAAGFAAGGLIIAGKTLHLEQCNAAALYLLCILTVTGCFTSVCLAFRKLPDRKKLLCWLDSEFACGGVLAASADTDVSVWQYKLPELDKINELPGRKKSAQILQKLTGVAAAGCIFAVTAYLIPESAVPLRNDEIKRLNIEDEKREIQDKIQILENEGILPEEKLAEFREAMENISNHDAAQDSAKTYEMLEILENKLDTEISSLTNTLVSSAVSMDKLSELLEAMQQQDNLPPEAAENFAALLSRLAAEDPELAKLLKELQFAGMEVTGDMPGNVAQKTLTKEELEKLAKALEKNIDKIKQKLREMTENSCASCGGGCSNGKCVMDAETLEEWLNSNAPGAAALMSAVCENGAGQGAINQGRGDAPLNFTGNTPEIQGKFTELGVDGMAVPDGGDAVRRTLTAPQINEDETELSTGGKLGGGGSDFERGESKLLPLHKNAVKRYFDK